MLLALSAFGCATGYHGQSLSGGFSETQLDDIQKPGLANAIVCFKERPQDIQGLVYNADFVYRSLTQKYGLQLER